MKLQIEIPEVAAGAKYCGECDRRDGGWCNEFYFPLIAQKDSVKLLRLPECLAAEIPELQWRTGKPEKNGWYWVDFSINPVFYVANDGVFMLAGIPISDCLRHAGPLPSPAEPAAGKVG